MTWNYKEIEKEGMYLDGKEQNHKRVNNFNSIM